MVIAVFGSAAGTIIAVWLVRTYAASLPVFVPGVAVTGIDLRVLAISAALSILAGALFSLAPMLRLGRSHLAHVARLGAIPAGRHRWLSSSLLVSQITIALLLLAATSTLLPV